MGNILAWIKSKSFNWKVLFGAGLIFGVICFIMTNKVIEFTSKSDAFCAACHEMKTAYSTWELSTHGANHNGIRVECIQCHLPPREKYFSHLTVKAYTGIKDVVLHYIGGEYEPDTLRKEVLKKISSNRCLNCHNSLLTKPSGAEAMKAHIASLVRPETPEGRCVACHEKVGHERINVLFSE